MIYSFDFNFQLAKQRTASLYLSVEPNMRELPQLERFNRRMAFATFHTLVRN